MGKESKPNFPGVPEYQSSPNVKGDIDLLSRVGRGLTSGDFMDANDPQLGFLNELVRLNPEATQQAVGLATRDVERVRNQAQQDVLNQLEANNQLTSSTSVNRLSSLNEAFSQDISDIATQFYLADVERSLGNIGNLFQLGLGTTESSATLGLNQQAQENSFALERFDRQVSLEAERFARQQAQTAALGKLAGFYLPAGIGTAVAGAFGGQTAATGAQAGSMDTINLGLQAFSAFRGGGAQSVGGGTTGGASSSGINWNGLSQQDMLNANRINKGFGFNTSGGLA